MAWCADFGCASSHDNTGHVLKINSSHPRILLFLSYFVLHVSAKSIAFAFTHMHTSCWFFGLFLCGVSKMNSGLPNGEHMWAVYLFHKRSSSTYYKPVTALNTWQISNLITTTILDWWTPGMKQMACSNQVIKSNLMEGLFLKVSMIKGIQQGIH